MANSEHVVLLSKGSELWNQWRRDHPDIVPDLRVAHLRQADLCDMDLSGAILSVAILHSADLTGADLRGADLSRADLRGINLRHAILEGAKSTHGGYSRRPVVRAERKRRR